MSYNSVRLRKHPEAIQVKEGYLPKFERQFECHQKVRPILLQI
jgi:hypothetical protein